MQPVTRFHSLLEVLIRQEVESRKDELSTGIADPNKYWRCVGEISGLRGALRLCEDIERDLNERSA